MVIAIGLLLRERYAAIVVSPPIERPQLIPPSVIATPTTPPPRIYRLYLPLQLSRYQQSKKCVALSSGYSVAMMMEIGARCTYSYWPAGQSANGIEFDGMAQYPDAITVTGESPYVFGFNEPDLGRFKGGPPVTPQMAAEIWPRVVAANPGKLLVSPAPSQLHPEWLAQFYQAHLSRWGYTPKLDVLAIHCYISANECIKIVSQVIGYAEKWNIPQVWVTEFAFSSQWQENFPTGATEQSESIKFIEWMNQQSKITRYYWWALAYDSDDPKQWWNYDRFTQLYDWHAGGLNERGQFYQSVR